MRQIKRLFRLVMISFILARYGVDKLILSHSMLYPVRFLIYLNPFNWFRRKSFKRAEALRLALLDLGPIFVKFGQTLSTRRDFVPDDIALELAKLQDKVPPFASDKVHKILRTAYDRPILDIFSEFDDEPLASASIAQVHAVTLCDGTKAVAKIVRPNIKRQIKRDVDLMMALAKFAERFWAEGRRLKLIEVVKEFETTINDELDLMREAANASQLRRNFDDKKLLYVPEVYWEYTRDNILVMERIYGIQISDMDQLKAHNVDIKKLAERGVEIFFTQVFRDSFFHADMHPGNVFVSYDRPDDPQYIAVDFGIIGALDEHDKRYLAENFHAFFRRDYYRVAELHVESGWVPYGTRITEFEAAIRTVCEPIFEKPFAEISFAQMLLRLFQTGRRFNMIAQPQLILLQKTLFSIEGLGRTLYPELDLWDTAKPFIEDWMTRQLGPRGFLKKSKAYAPYWADRLPELPQMVYDTLQFHRKSLLKENSKDGDQIKKESSFATGALGFGVGASMLAASNVWFLSVSTFRPETITSANKILFFIGLGFIALIGLTRKRT